MDSGTVHNLLRGTYDLSGVRFLSRLPYVLHWAYGDASILVLPGASTLQSACFRTLDGVEEATGNAEYVLSFMAKADVAGDRLHAEVWGSRWLKDYELGSGWKRYSMAFGIVNASNLLTYFAGLESNSGGVYVALPMAERGLVPHQWAPAEGESVSGGGCVHGHESRR